MRYPNKKITVPSTNGNCDQMARRIAQASTAFFITRPGNVKIGTIGQNHWNDDVIPFFPQERYNTIEVMMMPNADAIALGKQIKAVRKAMKMTQEQLALKSNVSVKYIANIENGKQNPSFDILSSILHVLPLSLGFGYQPELIRSRARMSRVRIDLFCLSARNAKNSVGCHKVTRNPFDRTFRTEQKHLSCQSGRYASLWRSFV